MKKQILILVKILKKYINISETNTKKKKFNTSEYIVK